MPKTLDNHLSYSGGEFSPLLDARVDHPKYQAACRTLQNMIVLEQGGCTRRPGTKRIAAAKQSAANYSVRLIKFQFSPTTSFVFEFGHQYIRFYSNGAQVQSGGIPLEVATPYGGTFAGNGQPWDAEIWAVTPCQVNDVVYLTHPLYPPYKLTRIADDDWTMAVVNFMVPAMLDKNATGLYMDSSALTGSVTLDINGDAWATATFYKVGDAVNEASALYVCVVGHTSGVFATDLASGYWVEQFPFQAGHIGSVWQIGHLRDSAYIEIEITANGSSSEIEALGDCTLETFGTWTGDVLLERRDPDGTSYTTVRIITSREDHNASIPLKLTDRGTYRITIENWVTAISATTPRAVFTVDGQVNYGLVEITAVASAYQATGNVIKQIESLNTTDLWSEGAWSTYRGFPRAVTFFQQRMVYGGTEYEPQRIWGTCQNDIENFDLGDQSLATDSYAFDIAATGRGPILWLLGQVDLFAGFSGAEWIINAGGGAFGGSNEPITPTQINAGEHSSWGSCPNVLPEIVGGAAMYTQRSAQTIQQMMFSVYTNKYQSNDITVLSNHLFGAGVAQIAYQAQFGNQSIVWVVNKAGALVGMTYDIQTEVYAWHRHITGYNPDDDSLDAFESVAVVDGQGTEDDNVWVVVDRPAGRSIELINPTRWQMAGTPIKGIAQPDPKLAFYVDAGITVAPPASSTISGLGHLVGRPVVALINGNMAVGPYTVSAGGTITIDGYEPAVTDVLQVGSPIYYEIEGMRMDVTGQAGVVIGVTKALSRVFLRVFNSLSGKVKGDGTKEVPIEYRARSLAVTEGTPLFTGQREVVPESTQSDDPRMMVKGHDPYPLTLLATTVRIGITGSA